MNYPEKPGYKKSGTSKDAADFYCIVLSNMQSLLIRKRGESYIPILKTNKCSACAVRVRDGYIAGESTFLINEYSVK